MPLVLLLISSAKIENFQDAEKDLDVQNAVFPLLNFLKTV
jgi:hypothetical protein